MPERAIVIGAGIGGLASALRLNKKGYEVTLIEANDYPGGKLHSMVIGDYRFDLGPSLFTLPELVDELFRLYDLEPTDFFTYHKKDTICNYFWEDGTRFSAKSDLDRFVKDACDIFGESEKSLREYLEKNRKKYNLTAKLFLERSLHKFATFLNTDALKALTRFYLLDISKTMDKVHTKAFSNPKLVQLFNRYATYNGSSPYKTPGIMSMIPHLEMQLGTFFPKGGMHSISLKLYELAVAQGIKFRFGEKVRSIRIDKGEVAGVLTEKATYKSEVVVSNMDVYHTYNELLKGQPKPERVIRQERSSSALIFYWGVSGKFPELDLHNILFSDSYEAEFNSIFNLKEVPDDPTIYINITSKEEPSDALEGHENWFVMINTPANFGQDWQQIREKARKQILKKISRILGLSLENRITTEHVLDPIGIENDTRSYRGSLYGTASNSQFAAFLRHPNFSKIKNLFFCGGSVHPGGGIPLCLLSAKIVEGMVPNPS